MSFVARESRQKSDATRKRKRPRITGPHVRRVVTFTLPATLDYHPRSRWRHACGNCVTGVTVSYPHLLFRRVCWRIIPRHIPEGEAFRESESKTNVLFRDVMLRDDAYFGRVSTTQIGIPHVIRSVRVILYVICCVMCYSPSLSLSFFLRDITVHASVALAMTIERRTIIGVLQSRDGDQFARDTFASTSR